MTSRADLQRIMVNTRLSEDKYYEQEMASLKELDRILGRAEVAEALYSLDDGETLSAAVNKLADRGLAERYGTPFRDPVLDELEDYDESIDEDFDEFEDLRPTSYASVYSAARRTFSVSSSMKVVSLDASRLSTLPKWIPSGSRSTATSYMRQRSISSVRTSRAGY